LAFITTFRQPVFFAESHGIEVVFSQQFFGNKFNAVLTGEAGNILGSVILKERITFNYAAGVTTTETMPEKTSEGLGTIKLSVGLRFNK